MRLGAIDLMMEALRAFHFSKRKFSGGKSNSADPGKSCWFNAELLFDFVRLAIARAGCHECRREYHSDESESNQKIVHRFLLAGFSRSSERALHLST
jgi:hypothetical protein